MWSLKINDIILDYYSEFYTQRERNYYKIDVLDSIVGGTRGLKMILGEKPNLTDPYELYTEHLVDVARKIADEYYMRTCDPLTRTVTIIPNTEIKIEVAGRSVAMLYVESTTRCSAIEIEIDEPTINIPPPYTITLEKTKEEILPITTKKKYRVVSPHLYLIDYLHKINDPLKQSDRQNNIELIKKLSEKTDVKYFNGKYYDIDSEIDYAIKMFGNDLKLIINNRVFIGFRNNMLILASDIESDDEYKFLSKYSFDIKKHKILLPNELFLLKVIGKYKSKNKFKICIYNIGYHEIIPINIVMDNKLDLINTAYPSLRSRLFMIEDNILHSLHSIGKADFLVYYMSKQDLEDAINEEYPNSSNKEEMNEMFKHRFYGIYRNMSTVKKLYIKEQDKIGHYYSYVQKHKLGETCVGSIHRNQPYDKKIIKLT